MVYPFCAEVSDLLNRARRISSRRNHIVDRSILCSNYVKELSTIGVEPKEYEQAIKALANIFEV